jgi:Cadherin-like/Nidogen-like/FecR protein
LNFVGKFDPGHASSHSGGPIDAVPHHGSTDAITIADAGLLFTGDFKRSGPDLVLSKDGHDLVVQDYFKGETRAALASPDGARLSGSIVDALTGHVEYAQADGSVAAAKVIGHVTKLAGSATAIRNGVSIQLNMGDNVDKGDVVQAGGGSSLGLTFIDGTVFGLSSNARMVLNEMVYDPNGSSNSSLLSLVQGTITFVAGETAKHGDMRVDTPTATMGIRGTAVLVEIDFDVPAQGNAPPVKFQVLVEPNGVTGSYVLYSKTSPGLVLGTVNQAGQITSVNGFGDTSQSQAPPLTGLEKLIIEQTFGLYFPNYVPNPNPQSTGPHGSTPANPPGSLIPEPQKFYDLPVGAPQLIPIKLPGNTQDLSPIIIPVTVTILKTIDVTPVVNKASFSIADQVTIQDSNPSDPIVKYVPGTAKILSVTVVGPGNVPAGVDLTKFIVVDPQTGAVSPDLAKFAFLGENQKAIVTIGFDSSAGSDTFHSTLTETINGVNDPPVITAASLAVAENGTVLFTAANLGIADPDSTSFTFTVSNVTHGTFQITTDGINWTDATTFTSAELATGHVRFKHDGGGDAPTFSIQADDGASANHLSNVFNGSIDFTHVNQPPVITAASLTVAEGGTVMLTPANLGVTDPDSKTFTFTVSDVTHGTFQTTTNGEDWTDATTFTSADLAANHVRFVHDGGEAAPTFSIQADDGASSNHLSNVLTGSVDFTHVNDPPVITAASLTVVEGGTVPFTPANLGITDPDSTSFTFTVSHVTHGTFQTTTDGEDWTDATSFTSADLAAGRVRFVHDGGEAAPTFSIQADDGASTNHLSNVFTGSVDFTNVNDPPVITAASLTVVEGGTVAFTPANLGITDPDSTSFTFTVSHVTHGTFQTTTDGVYWTDATTFTSAALAAGHVRFMHDGGEAAPTFSIQADDGASTNHLSDVFTGSVVFTNVNDAPVITAGSVVNGAISVALPIGSLTPIGAAILTAPSGLISGLGTDTGYGILALAHGDDNSSGAIDITSVFGPAGIDFFGTHYTSLYINNNGNITFEAPNGAYTPTAINAGFHNPIIAAFWADVDTRGHGNVYYDEDAADGVMTITWDHVGYYNQRSDKLDSFQIVLINEGNGNFDILYRYGQMQWTTGDASGGTGGLGGTVARAGYSAGDGVHYFELPQSGSQSALLALPTTPGNTGIAGVDEFQVRNGEVGPTTVTKSGTINFADPDLTDTHHIASVKYTGTASQLGTLAVTLLTDTTGTGINGQFAWTYTADTAAVQAALLYTNDGSQIATFDVVIDDGHGGVVTQTVAVTLTASNADVWNGQGGNANWSLGHAPTATEVAYVDTTTTLSLDVSHLTNASVGGLHVSSQSQIDLTASGHAGSFAVDGALINLGHIVLTDNTTLEASGAIHNSGTITIDAAAESLHGAAPGATLLIDGTVVLDGGGTVTLDGTNDRITGTYSETATSTLENVDNTINGFGKLGDDHLHLINDAGGIIDATGLLTIDTDHTITNNGLLEVATGGTLVVDDAVVGAGSEKIGAGGILEFGSSVASTQTVTFTGSTGTLKIDNAASFHSTIAGLGSDGTGLYAGADHIDLANVAFASLRTPTFDSAHDILTVSDGTHTASLQLTGSYSLGSFHFQSDGHGGTMIWDPPESGGPGANAATAQTTASTIAASGPNAVLTGNAGSDNFVFDFANVGQATVTNFHADTDLLQFKTSMFANAQAVLDATQDDVHGNAVIALDAHDSITLTGVTKAQLHQADFHLV